MISNGRTAPQPSAFRKTPTWTSQTSRDNPRPSFRDIRPPGMGWTASWTRAMRSASDVLSRVLRGRAGLEDRPADRGAVLVDLSGLVGADEVVLADRAGNADRPLCNHGPERRIRAVDVVERAGVDGD